YRQQAPTRQYPGNSRCGTQIVLSNLKHVWGHDELVDLAQEIWWLRPPFESGPRSDEGGKFDVEVATPDPEAASKFKQQMTAYLNIWYAKIRGKLELQSKKNPGTAKVKVAIEFADGQKTIQAQE